MCVLHVLCMLSSVLMYLQLVMTALLASKVCAFAVYDTVKHYDTYSWS